jgi:hypothetical protein
MVPHTRRSAWTYALGESKRIDTAVTPICTVGIAADENSHSDARDWDSSVEVPIRAQPSATAEVVARALTGQRFVCDLIQNGWYRIYLTDACPQPKGWISGVYLFSYHEEVAQPPHGIVLGND